MNDDIRQMIQSLLSDPDRLLQKKPFYRKIVSDPNITVLTGMGLMGSAGIGDTVRARIPSLRRMILTNEQVMREFDPWSHSVLTDENVPCITVKSAEGGWINVEQKRMPASYQQCIVKKQTLHLCKNPMSHTLLNQNPTEAQGKHFIKIKEVWKERNLDGLKTDCVFTQKSQLEVGLLFYFDHRGKVRARVLKYSDGYNIITHKDNNGDHILECVYYSKDNVDYIDCYDDNYMYRISSDGDIITDEKGVILSEGWRRHEPVRHGFSECPLITKRGPVAWDNVQDLIEVYERTYNTFMVIQNRYGWGVLYIKGKFNQTGQKVAGNVVLNDSSLDPNADAKILTPPSPANMIETLDQLENSIQKGAGSTFILPKDIKMSGDTSGIAVQLTQELDIETAMTDVIEWQNFANKMMRLFKEGLAIELVNGGEPDYANAITDFAKLRINSEFVVWRPQSNEAYNQMLTTLHGAGGISARTLIEKNTESCPDEVARISREEKEKAEKEIEMQRKLAGTGTETTEETIVSDKE